MSDWKESQKLTWRQLFTKLKHTMEYIAVSFETVKDEFFSVIRESGTILVSVSGFGWSLLVKPRKNLAETLLIMTPAVVLTAGVFYLKFWIFLIATLMYLAVFFILISINLYDLPDRLVKYGYLWYVLGIVSLIFSFFL